MAIAVTTSCLVSARGVMRRIPGICRTIVASADRYPRHGTITTAPLVLLLMRYACLRRGRQRTASLSTAAGTSPRAADAGRGLRTTREVRRRGGARNGGAG